MQRRSIPSVLRGVAASAIVAGAVVAATGDVAAHENHAPLPTKGVTIAGDTIMLSDKARAAIGLTTAKIAFGNVHRTVTVNARVELPWHSQAMITSLVPGKIEQVLVRPGETVAAGQELARMTSMELASLQLALLQARGEAALARKLVDQKAALDQQGVIAGKSLLEAQATLAEKSAALEIARQKAGVARTGQDGDPTGGTERPAAFAGLDHDPARRNHHPRGCPHRPTDQRYGSPLSRRAAFDALDCGRGTRV